MSKSVNEVGKDRYSSSASVAPLEGRGRKGALFWTSDDARAFDDHVHVGVLDAQQVPVAHSAREALQSGSQSQFFLSALSSPINMKP